MSNNQTYFKSSQRGFLDIISAIVLAVLLVGIPITTYLSQQSQDTRKYAQEMPEIDAGNGGGGGSNDNGDSTPQSDADAKAAADAQALAQEQQKDAEQTIKDNAVAAAAEKAAKDAADAAKAVENASKLAAIDQTYYPPVSTDTTTGSQNYITADQANTTQTTLQAAAQTAVPYNDILSGAYKEVHSVIPNNSTGINYPSKDPFTGLPIDENGNILFSEIPFDQLYPEIKTTEIILGEIINRGASNWQWDPNTLDYIFPNVDNIRSQYSIQDDNNRKKLLRDPINRIPYVNVVQDIFYNTLDIGYLTPSLRRETFLRASAVLNNGLGVEVTYETLKPSVNSSYAAAGYGGEFERSATAPLTIYADNTFVGKGIKFNTKYHDSATNQSILTLGHEGTHTFDEFKTSALSEPLFTQGDEFGIFWDVYDLWAISTEYNAYKYQADVNTIYGVNNGTQWYQDHADSFFRAYPNKREEIINNIRASKKANLVGDKE